MSKNVRAAFVISVTDHGGFRDDGEFAAKIPMTSNRANAGINTFHWTNTRQTKEGEEPGGTSSRVALTNGLEGTRSSARSLSS